MNMTNQMQQINSTLIITPDIGSYSGNSATHKRETSALVDKRGAEKGALRVRFNRFNINSKNVLGMIGAVNRRVSKVFTCEEEAAKHGVLPALPLINGGYQIDAKDRSLYEGVFDAANAEINNLKRRIARDYPALVAEGKRKLGDVAASVTYPSAEELAKQYGIKAVFSQEPGVVAKYGATRAMVGVALNKGVALANHQSTLMEQSFGKMLSDLAKEMERNRDKMEESMNKKGGRVRNENITNIQRKGVTIKSMAARYGISDVVSDAISKVCNTITSSLSNVDMTNLAPPEREEVLDKISSGVEIVTHTSEDIMKW